MRISDWSSDVCSSDLIAYAAWKEEQLAVALQRRGLVADTLHPLRRVAPGRRRRITWSAKRTARGALLGYYERESHQLADIDACLLVTPALQALLAPLRRSEEHTYELQSLMRISYAVFWLKKKN